VANVAGGNILARWTRIFDEGSDLSLRAYYDGTHRDDPSFLDNLDTIDVDFQHRFQLPLRQELIWGLAARSMDNRNRGKGLLQLDPPDSRDNVFSGFVQDQIAVLQSLKLTLGTKLEHNDFSGVEYQPSARIAWNPFAGQLLWGAVSRAVRVPTRIERDIDVSVTAPGQTPVVKLLGSRAYGSERLLAWELGYRWHIQRALFVDLAAYYNDYHGLDSLEFDPAFVDPRTGQTVVPIVNKNLSDGVSKGGEASLTFTPVRQWRLVGNYTWTVVTIHPNGQDLNGGRFFAGFTPRHQIELQSFLDLPGRFQLDAFFRYATSIGYPPSVDPSGALGVAAYATADVRASWTWRRLDFSLVGRSLLQAHHLEFPGAREVRRSAYLKVAGRF
jgi:iron complex outermembrane receptor protein